MPHHKTWACIKPDGPRCDGDHHKNRFDDKPDVTGPMTSHDLAKKLLELPNGEIRFRVVIEKRISFSTPNIGKPWVTPDELISITLTAPGT